MAKSQHVSAFLPSGRRMAEHRYPAEVQAAMEGVAAGILAKLLAPLVGPWRARRARWRLTAATIAGYEGGIEAVYGAAEAALRFTSAVAQALTALSGLARSGVTAGGAGAGGDAGGEGEEAWKGVGGAVWSGTASPSAGSPKAGAGAGSDRRGSRPPRSSSSLPTQPLADETAEGAQESDTAESDKGNDGTTPEAEGEAAPVVFPGTAFTAAAHAPVPLSPAQQQDADTAMGRIAATLRGGSSNGGNDSNGQGSAATLRPLVFLEGEWLQSAREPAHEVLILLAGSLRRRQPALPAGVGGGGGAASPVAVPNSGSGAPPSRRRSAFSSVILRRVGAASSPSPAASAQWQTLHAPLVLGELAVLGGFPYCEDLAVESPRCLVARLPKAAYCALVSEAVPHTVQRRLLLAALQRRQVLLPWFAPMTEARLRLSPLLAGLGRQELWHVRDHVVPRVFAAGMACLPAANATGGGSPSVYQHSRSNINPAGDMMPALSSAGGGGAGSQDHILFIRRGLVRLERQGLSSGAERWAAASACNRTLLTDGQTFGELQCIIRDGSGGDACFAVSQVDAYLLPFRVIIQLMKQQPEVQTVVYAAARAVAAIRERDYTGLLQFNPAGEPVLGLEGVASRRSGLFLAAGRSNSGGGGRRGSGGGGGRRASMGGATPSARGSRTNSPSDSMITGGGGDGSAPRHGGRRVTIHEAEVTSTVFPPSESRGNYSYSGGGGAYTSTTAGSGRGMHQQQQQPLPVSLQEAMRRVPLLSLVAPPDVLDELAPYWQLTRYAKGQPIVRRGDECNRVLLFGGGGPDDGDGGGGDGGGRGAIVIDERALRQELKPTPYGTAADLSALATQQQQQQRHNNGTMGGGGGACGTPLGYLQVIPPGHSVGYTCVLRHRWTRSIVAVDDGGAEVWELPRAALVAVLRRHGASGLHAGLCAAALQLLQPLASPSAAAAAVTAPQVGQRPRGGSRGSFSSMDPAGSSSSTAAAAAIATANAKAASAASSSGEHRIYALDCQPLLRPMPSSLWSEQPLVNVHPVSTRDGGRALFPAWREGDFPLDQTASRQL